jgi:hypothetical protein
VLAVGALCGVPVQRIVEGDQVEVSLWSAVTARSAELYVQMMEAQAAYIAARFR